MMAHGNGKNNAEHVRNELDELKRRVARLEATKAQLDRAKERVAEQPTVIDLQNFRHELSMMERHDIGEKRFSGEWGNIDPNDPTKSSWRVREANRYLTAEKERLKVEEERKRDRLRVEEERKRDRHQRQLQWIGIVVSGIIALAGVFVAILGL
jgi:hypothetical protein